MAFLRRTLSARFPDSQSILLVFAAVSLVFYGWTIVSSAWKLNSWLNNLNVWEILSLFSYLFIWNFLESVAVLAGLLGLSTLLPGKFLKEKFVVRGVIVAFCLIGSMMLQLKLYTDGMRGRVVDSLGLWWFITVVALTVLAWVLPKWRAGETLVQEFADRSTVFLYIFMPLTAIGFLVIVFRIFLST